MSERGKRRGSFPDEDELAATVDLFVALANPTRLKLLVALGRTGPMTAGALQELVGGEQSAVSHQLAALRRARLVEVEPHGRQRIYRLLDDHVAHIVDDALRHASEPQTESAAPLLRSAAGTRSRRSS